MHSYRAYLNTRPFRESFRTILELAQQVREGRPDKDLEDCLRFEHLSSEASSNVSHLTALSIPLVCWIEDEVLVGVKTFPLRGLYLGNVHSPAHPKRLESRDTGQRSAPA